MNLYSNKQNWKIAFLVVALLLVGASLFVSNQIVTKVGEQEKQHAKQWADAIKKKVELVQLTNRTFTQLREKEREKMELWIKATKEVSEQSFSDHIPEFQLQIVKDNVDIPVILLSNENEISGYRNIAFDTSDLQPIYPTFKPRELNKKYEDSLVSLSEIWKEKNPSFTIEVYEGLFMTYVYDDSKEITKLEKERDLLFESFNEELIRNEGLVPVVLLDQKTREVIGSNIAKDKLSETELPKTISNLAKRNDSLIVFSNKEHPNVLYIDTSAELKQLKYFPYIQFLIIGLFVFIGYLIFSTFRKAEQNQVWAGMAKETAHQLGTPLSSLLAWVQLLEAQEIDPMIVEEMQKDVTRLQKVSDRFSKIGSEAKLKDTDINSTVKEVVEYLRPRISQKVKITFTADKSIVANHNASLIEWVVENICKNAVDAMEGKGELHVTMSESPEWVHISIRDTGKGMTPKQIKSIFKPGYTTKKRGWGLGLSLVRRIVKEYHHGRVFVLESHVNVGTTFRISIPLKEL